MKAVMKELLILSILSMMSVKSLASSEVVLDSGSVAQRWLNIPASARVAALAGASVAQEAELGALEANPAGLAGIDSWQLSFTHNSWVHDVSVERAAGALHTDALGTLALSYDYLN